VLRCARIRAAKVCCCASKVILKTSSTALLPVSLPSLMPAGASMFRTFAGYRCSTGEYNDIAVLAFNPQGFKIQALFASPSLLLYSSFYYLLGALTYGAFIPSGLFTVSLIFGGCFGRLWGEILAGLHLIDASQPGIMGMYALLGAGRVGCTAFQATRNSFSPVHTTLLRASSGSSLGAHSVPEMLWRCSWAGKGHSALAAAC